MAKLKDLKVTIGLNKKGLSKLNADLRTTKANFKRNFGEIQGMVKGVGRGLTAGLTAPLALMGAQSVKAFNEQAKAIAQVEAGLKSTSNAVGFTSEQLQQMASSLQAKTIFGDEEILKGATAQLLTFTNIAGEQFGRTQKIALDLATRLDGDLKSSSIMLGKALNDPVANLSALSRAGIQFSEDQKEVVKSLVETGKLADAQTLILNELEKQYGGSAEAAAKAGTGPFKQLQNTLGDLSEEFGKLISDVLTPIIPKITSVVAAFSNLSTGTKQMILNVAALLGAAGPIAMAVAALMPIFAALTGPIGLTITAVVALATAVIHFRKDISGPLADVANFFVDIYNEVAPIRIAIAILTTAVKANFKAMWNAAKAFGTGLMTIGRALITLITERDFSKFGQIMTEGFSKIGQDTFDTAVSIGEDFAAAIEDGYRNRLERIDASDIESALDLSNLLDFGAAGGVTPVTVPVTPTLTTVTGGRAEVTMDVEELIDEPHIDALVSSYEKHMNRVKWATKSVNQVMGTVGGAIDAVFSNIRDKSQGFHLYMKDLLKDLLMRLTKLVATYAILSVLLGGATGMAAAGFKGGMKGFMMGGMGLVPQMADGGLFTGASLAQVGEGPGTSAINPEVVAPLDKLRDMIGGGAVTVTGMIRGNDILLSNERSKIDRNRVRGF